MRSRREESSHQNHVLGLDHAVRESHVEVDRTIPYFNNATKDLESQKLKVRSQKLKLKFKSLNNFYF